MFEPETPEAVSQRRGPGFREADAKNLRRSNRSQLNPIAAESIPDFSGDHIH